MVAIPKAVIDTKTQKHLESIGLNMIHRGKVRDTYRVSSDALLVVASNRISIFDFVLKCQIPAKGEYLTAMTHFWLTQILSGFKNHLISDMYRKMDDLDIPTEIQKRALLVKDLSEDLLPFELIFRAHIGGSRYKEYVENGGVVAGAILQVGQDQKPLPKWSKLDIPAFTPTTKEQMGHDQDVTVGDFQIWCQEKHINGQKVIDMAREAYVKAYQYAQKRRVLILDTKFEATADTLADEILTPDSSRFVDQDNWEEAISSDPPQEPEFYDKQLVRKWGSEITTRLGTGIKRLDPTDPEDIAFVQNQKVPNTVIADIVSRYMFIFHRITKQRLYVYQRDCMGI